MTYIDNYIE